MIKVLIEGHDYEHDLFELIRVFFPDQEIEFISEYARETKGLFINSSLLGMNNTLYAVSKIFNKDQLIKETTIDISDISIYSYSKKIIRKNAIKKSIYDSLIGLTDFDIPWGILTGIRPIKVAHNLLDTNTNPEEVKKILINEYCIHEKKAQMMIDIAESQRKHIYPLDENKYSLYIGIPFCPSRCSYCSFPAFAIGGSYDKVSKYVNTLVYEIGRIKEIMTGKYLNTVYIGGGTPTSLKVNDLELIIATVRDSFNNENIKEFTVEAGRPDTLNLDTLKMLKSMEIDRISINPQTMNLPTLDKIGRNHDLNSIIKTFNMAKDLGFDSINMDIILGLPGEGIDEVAYTLDEIKKLNPDNLTVHTLAIKRGSKLINRKDHILKEYSDISNTFELTRTKATEMDMSPYYLYRQKQILGNLENVGYAKPEKECIYNISMMEEKETIIGAGLGAVSKLYYPKENKIKRIPNFKSLNDYNNRIDESINKKIDTI